MASRKGHLQVVRRLLEGGAETDAKDSYGNTALHAASRNGHLEIVELLLSKGAKVDAKEEDDITALHYACEYGYLELAKLLLDKGANANAVDDENRMPLRLACLINNTEMAAEIIIKGGTLGELDEDSDDEEDEDEDRAFWRTHARAAHAARTRRDESVSAASNTKDKRHSEEKASTLGASNAIKGRLWKLVSPLPGTTEAEKPSAEALLADPEAVLAPFEGAVCVCVCVCLCVSDYLSPKGHPVHMDFPGNYKDMAGYDGTGRP
jgi:hypothetical protein